jgi:mono/diheme cytochrome c family protein
MRRIMIGLSALWLALGAAPLAADEVERFTDGDAANGAKLYKQYCRGCHGEDGRGGAHTFMPHIHTLTKKDYIELTPDSYLAEVIAEGGAAFGKSSYMPSWKSKLSEQEIKDIVAHIRTLPTY